MNAETTVPLLPVFTVHCFFGTCTHVEREFDSSAASAAMQHHYDVEHVDDLTRMGYPPRTRTEGSAA